MYTDFLKDPNFFLLLLKIDKEIIEIVSVNPCQYCRGKMDRSDFKRKPRGEPQNLPEEFFQRLSICCRNEGCRHRLTPNSVRFFSRRRWLAPIFLVASILRGDCDSSTFRKFCRDMGINPKLVKSWRRWWNSSFCSTPTWQKIQGFFSILPSASTLPEFFYVSFLQRNITPKEAIIESLKLLTSHVICGKGKIRRIEP